MRTCGRAVATSSISIGLSSTKDDGLQAEVQLFRQLSDLLGFRMITGENGDEIAFGQRHPAAFERRLGIGRIVPRNGGDDDAVVAQTFEIALVDEVHVAFAFGAVLQGVGAVVADDAVPHGVVQIRTQQFGRFPAYRPLRTARPRRWRRATDDRARPSNGQPEAK